MNEEYIQGFIQKCAEAGVDPEALVKTAQADPDRLLAYLTNLMPGASGLYGASRAPEGEKLLGALKGQAAGTAGRVAGGIGSVGLGGLLGALAGAPFGRAGLGAGLGVGAGTAASPLGWTVGGGEATYRAAKKDEPIGKLGKIKAAVLELVERMRK